jgi:hypothetical protein
MARLGSWVRKRQVLAFHAAMAGAVMTMFALALVQLPWALGSALLTL